MNSYGTEIYLRYKYITFTCFFFFPAISATQSLASSITDVEQILNQTKDIFLYTFIHWIGYITPHDK
jgi:hypothetical protein